MPSVPGFTFPKEELKSTFYPNWGSQTALKLPSGRSKTAMLLPYQHSHEYQLAL